MRVIAGELRGRRFKAPKGRETRPTPDRVREAVFGILVHDVPGARVLDLFAGSGALGIEALSRGARSAVFVDSSRTVCRLVQENLVALGLADRGTIVCHDAVRYLASSPSTGPFDLIFADPPYTIGPVLAGDVARLLAAGGWMAPSALFVVEHADAAPWGDLDGLVLVVRRRYGDTAVSVYAQEGEPSQGQ